MECESLFVYRIEVALLRRALLVAVVFVPEVIILFETELDVWVRLADVILVFEVGCSFKVLIVKTPMMLVAVYVLNVIIALPVAR